VPFQPRVLTPLAPLALAASFGAPTEARAEPTQPETLQNPLASAFECADCHSFDNPAEHASEPPVAPWESWRYGLMAQSARDPVFWAGVALAAQDIPGATEVCIRCHSPRAFLEGNGSATQFDELDFNEADGVDCEFCHRLVEDPAVPPGNGQYTIDDAANPSNFIVPRRGPWDYPSDGSRPLPSHDWIYDPYISSSRLCGTCHDVTTPAERIGLDGVGMGVPFNEQRTYSEWENSAFARGPDARTCQDCHMPAVANVAGCEAYNGFITQPQGRRHHLHGVNTMALRLVDALHGDEGTMLLDSDQLAASIATMEEFARTSATLDLAAPDLVDLRAGVEGLVVTVTNETGHKLPSGYSEGRVAWIELVASYGDEVVWSSGRWQPGYDPGSATVADDPSDPQLRTYKGIAERASDGSHFHLLRNDRWLLDSRLPPRGLLEDPETDPVGERYTLQLDGTWPHVDTAAYAFAPTSGVLDRTPLLADDDELEIRARLLMLINTPAYLEHLRDANTTNASGQILWDALADAPENTPVVLGEATVRVPLTGLDQPPPDPTGTTGTTTAGASTGDDTGSTGGDGTDSDTGTTTGTTAQTTGSATGETAGTNSETAGAAAGEDSGGCACHAARTTGPGGALGWAAFGLLAALRRRRRGSSARARS
jgi:MYXO-CTERM domain-containing protein